jgi:hypothetical protein
MKNPRILAVTACLLLGGVIGIAQKPERDISNSRHPNLAAAQRLCEQAWERIVEAQRANEFDMSGHGQRAKELLDQANHELKLAAQAANHPK